jgi:hypothetical protein
MRIVVAILALLLLAAATSSAQIGPRDFARGIDVRTQGTGAIYRVTLPRDVYATATGPSLDDLRVFNAAGMPVPITIRRALPASAASDAPVNVPLFPMSTTPAAGGASAQIKLDRQGAVVEVSGNREPGQALTSYLVDVSAIKAPLAGLSLLWEAREDASFLGHASVQGSDDLNQWRTLVSTVAVAQMRHGGFTITQREIELSGARARYLRIAWPPELRDVVLSGVQVRTQGSAPALEPTWEVMTAAPVAGAPGRASFDAGARLPVERLDLEFVDATDAATVTITSSRDPSDDAQMRYSGLFFSLTEASTRLTSSPARIAVTTDRYWTVETMRDGGWGGRLPRLRLGWYPQELLFMAQGAGPYTLAYGSGRARPTDAPVAAVLANLDETARSRIQSATLGAPYDLGGAAVLTAPRSWRRELLWGVLLAAVLALGVFALRLVRESRPS